MVLITTGKISTAPSVNRNRYVRHIQGWYRVYPITRTWQDHALVDDTSKFPVECAGQVISDANLTWKGIAEISLKRPETR